MICQKLASLQTLDPLPNQHVNIKQEPSLRASKNLQNPRHFLLFLFFLIFFLPLQLFKKIRIPYKSELPQIRG